MNRREALFSLGAMTAAGAAAATGRAGAEVIRGIPAATGISADHLPHPIKRGGFQVFTQEGDQRMLAAIFDRLIPADDNGPSATEAGCLDFVDRQLAGDYGAGAALYLEGPLNKENDEAIMRQPQFLATPRERYETGLKALEAYAQKEDGKGFADLAPERIDAILEGLEAGQVSLGDDVDGQAFFELMLQNVREGYLADPIYGGNRGMAGWKMMGFPGARYDFRPYIDRRGEDLGLTPVSLIPND